MNLNVYGVLSSINVLTHVTWVEIFQNEWFGEFTDKDQKFKLVIQETADSTHVSLYDFAHKKTYLSMALYKKSPSVSVSVGGNAPFNFASLKEATQFIRTLKIT